jgi:hypothetical protein
MMTKTMTPDNKNPESSHAMAPKPVPTGPPMINALPKKPPRHTNAGTVTMGRL